MQFLKDKGGLLCADVQGFVRVVGEAGRLQYERWPEQSAVLGLVDILKTDAVEAEFLTGESDIEKAAARLAVFWPREIVLTHRDGLLVLADGNTYRAAFYPEVLRGRSGRGDTCLGSYVASRLGAPPGSSTVWAAAATSLKMEHEGPVMCSPDEVELLIRQHYRSSTE
jgi:sugar/nucleoside kinase (ribokinase family)